MSIEICIKCENDIDTDENVDGAYNEAGYVCVDCCDEITGEDE